MTILIIGSNGMLGTDVVKTLKSNNNVIEITHNQLDITNLLDVQKIIKLHNPNVVINCAAYTKVDMCETEIDLAYSVNGLGPRNIAIACANINCKLVHISTDYVFDGNSNIPYKEYDNTCPLSIYGHSKLMGEKCIRDLCNKFFIIRVQWLYGINGNNFVKNIINLSKNRDEIKVVNDQFGCPTYTVDVSNFIKDIISTEEYGIYHVTNNGIVSWFEFTKEIYKLSNILTTVIPCTTAEFPRPAHRPKFAPLDNNMIKLVNMKPLQDYNIALENYLKELL